MVLRQHNSLLRMGGLESTPLHSSPTQPQAPNFCPLMASGWTIHRCTLGMLSIYLLRTHTLLFIKNCVHMCFAHISMTLLMLPLCLHSWTVLALHWTSMLLSGLGIAQHLQSWCRIFCFAMMLVMYVLCRLSCLGQTHPPATRLLCC